MLNGHENMLIFSQKIMHLLITSTYITTLVVQSYIQSFRLKDDILITGRMDLHSDNGGFRAD